MSVAREQAAMNPSTENQLKPLRCLKPSKRYFDFSSVDKENIEQGNNKPALDGTTVRKVSPTASSYRGRKNSDNSYDRPLRTKGLIEIDTTNNQSTITKRRNHSTSDTNGSKPFVKTRFSIYDDARTEEADQGTGKVINFKQAGGERTTQKTSYLRDIAPNNLFLFKKSNDSERKPIKKSSSRKIISPKDLPHIPQNDISKIKEVHKKAPILKKSRTVYDVLSLELAYNIDYMSEYVRFQMEINDKKRLSSSFLTQSVTPDQRRLIVTYLINATTYYKYPSFILYQAVKIFDFYIDTVNISVSELQSIALAALWIALKKDLIIDDVPEASMIIKLAGPTFQGDKKPLIDSEKKILMSLNFEISFAEPFSMLALYTVMIDEVRQLKSPKVQDLYYCGSYLIDLSLLHDKMQNVSAVHLAAISAEIALVLIMTSNDGIKNPQWSHWRNRVFASNPSLEKYRLPDSQVNQIRSQLLKYVLLSTDSKTDLYVVFKKYSSKRYGPVSSFIVKKTSALFISKINEPNNVDRPVHFV